jgi:hypothetical protein
MALDSLAQAPRLVLSAAQAPRRLLCCVPGPEAHFASWRSAIARVGAGDLDRDELWVRLRGCEGLSDVD